MARRQVVFIPAADSVVVMGPGIGDAVRLGIEGQAAVGPVLEVELDDLHARQVQGVFEGADVVSDDAQVFGDQAQPADFLVDRPEEVQAGPFFPGAALGCFRIGRYGPVSGKAAEMVDPDFVDEVHHAAEAVGPPLVVVPGHGLVIIEGIAPELAVGTEVVRRDTGDGRRIPRFIEVELFLMRPAVGTVMGDEHGHVAEDGHAVFSGIGPDIVPLAAEDVLHEFDMRYGAGQLLAILGQGGLAVMADIFRPFCPAAAAEEIADSPEECVVVEPVGILFTEGPERFPGNGQVRIMGHIPEEFGLICGQAVPGRSLFPLSQEIIQGFLFQPAPVAQDFQGNEGFVAGKGRFRQIRRIAHEGRRQGQDLPDPLAGGLEEVDEAVHGRP